MPRLPKPDPLFHQAVRTRLAVLLSKTALSFSELKSALEITDGNLDAHLRKLAAEGYIESAMVLEGRPHTRYALSATGRKAFADYCKTMRTLLDETDESRN
ncbi:MAG: transcriptional regulator [Hyphomicrobiaceae bacterium]